MALINILNIKVPLGNRIYSRKFTFYHLSSVNPGKSSFVSAFFLNP